MVCFVPASSQKALPLISEVDYIRRPGVQICDPTHHAVHSERIDPAVLYIAKCGHTVIQWLGLGLELEFGLGLGFGLRHFLERGFPMLLLTPSSSFSS